MTRTPAFIFAIMRRDNNFQHIRHSGRNAPAGFEDTGFNLPVADTLTPAPDQLPNYGWADTILTADSLKLRSGYGGKTSHFANPNVAMDLSNTTHRVLPVF